MDKFERLLKGRRQKAQKAADRVTQLAREGVRSVKSAPNKPDKMSAAPVSGSLPGKMQMELLSLSARQAGLDQKYEKNRERLMEYKVCEVTNEFRSKMDMDIHRAYYGDGGIRFRIETLLEHIKLLDPERDDVDTMIIHCYNSAISWMQQDVNKLVVDCGECSHELSIVKEKLRDDAVLQKALGYTDCEEQIKALKNAAKDELAMELPKLRAAVGSNDKALTGYIQRCKEGLSYRPWNNYGLFSALSSSLSQENTAEFAVAEGWDPESYYAAVTRFGNELKTELLEKYKVSED